MDCVVDPSAVLGLFLPDEQSPANLADVLWSKQGILHLPDIFQIEVRNALLKAERRKRVEASVVDQFVRAMETLRVCTYSATADLPASVALSRRYQISMYDALYVAMALRLNLPLATLDVQQSRAAAAEGVALLLS